LFPNVLSEVEGQAHGSRLRVNGLRLKSLNFSVRGELVEPQKNIFAIGSGDKTNGW